MTDAEPLIQIGTPGDWDEVSELLRSAFHNIFDEEERESERGVFEPERSLLVRDAGTVVAHAAAFTRDLTVPGNVVPAAHVTMVGVAPTHRRRRLLTRLMHRQLREVRDAGREAVAVLWASEGRIYPRFGYGLASQRLSLDIDLAEIRLPETATGRLRAGDPAALQPELAKVYEQLRADRPGWSSRDERWWRRVLTDPAAHRDGGTECQAVLHEGPGGVDGYALWRTKGDWDAGGPRGRVTINEVAAAGPEAYLALWRFLLSIDLTRVASFLLAATDEPLQHLVNEPRRLGATLADGLWVRLVDVGTALAARRYATPVDVVFDVTDPLLPENTGRWRLTADSGGARCTRTDGPAELACDVRDLAAVYLGGPSLGALAAAGRVRELRAGAVARASTAFGWHRAPVSMEVF
jgi:predicted acetyltransferase